MSAQVVIVGKVAVLPNDIGGLGGVLEVINGLVKDSLLRVSDQESKVLAIIALKGDEGGSGHGQ